jgi:hypothetical protein
MRLKPFTSDFPRANIYEMISPDLLHQLIKGTFKDHLVRWICEYLVQEHGERRASVILDDIDRRYGKFYGRITLPLMSNQYCFCATFPGPPPISSRPPFQAVDGG